MKSQINFSINLKTQNDEENFSGPFDLLLNLIDEQNLDISEISLSQVTEQFLNYLDNLESEKPDELADFLVIATKLLFLKSKKILPDFVFA